MFKVYVLVSFREFQWGNSCNRSLEDLISDSNINNSYKVITALGYVRSMRPTFHSLLAALGSMTITTSPTLRFSVGKNHFCLEPTWGRYSFIQRPHTCEVNSCTRLQCLRGLNVVLSTLSGTKSFDHLTNKEVIRCKYWLVVRVVTQCGQWS